LVDAINLFSAALKHNVPNAERRGSWTGSSGYHLYGQRSGGGGEDGPGQAPSHGRHAHRLHHARSGQGSREPVPGRLHCFRPADRRRTRDDPVAGRHPGRICTYRRPALLDRIKKAAAARYGVPAKPGPRDSVWVSDLYEYRLLPSTPELEASLSVQALRDLAAATLAAKKQELKNLSYPVWGLPDGTEDLVLTGIEQLGTGRTVLQYGYEGAAPEATGGAPAAVWMGTADLLGRSLDTEFSLPPKDRAVVHQDEDAEMSFRMNQPATGGRPGYMPNVTVVGEATPSDISLETYADLMRSMYPDATVKVESSTADRICLDVTRSSLGSLKVSVRQYIVLIRSGSYVYSVDYSTTTGGWAKQAPIFRKSAQTISIHG
jgi:hypothetical protein